MKRVALLLALVIALVALASCNEHVHTYEDAWSSDASGHWHNLTCDCEDAEPQKLDHVDKNNDKICDYCEFTDHTHTYSDKWTADADNHWYAADCGCTVEGIEKAAHADANGDGECDVCKYVVNNVHNHIFSDDWSHDDQYHWHAAICEHNSEMSDKEAHVLDDAGYCTVCEEKIVEVNDADIGDVLAAALARDHMVISGNVAYKNYIYEGTMDKLTVGSSLINNVYYVLGKGQSYINFASVINGVETAEQYWYEKLPNDTIFGVSSIDGGLTFEKVDGSEQHLNGYNYTPSGILAGFDNTYTLSQTLYSLYQLYGANNALNKSQSFDRGTYSFAFDYYIVNALEGLDPGDDIITDSEGNVKNETTTTYTTAYYTVSVTFSCDSNGVIDYANFVVDSYQEFNGTPADVDYNYNASTNTFNWTANKNPDRYQYEVNQISGERVYNSNYPYSSLVPQDFDLGYNNKPVGDSFNCKPGAAIYFTPINLTPSLSDPKYLYFNIDLDNPANSEVRLIKMENGNVATDKNGNPIIKFGLFNILTGQIGFMPLKGEWKLIIDNGVIYKELDVFVGDVTAESIESHVFYTNSGWGDTWLEVTAGEGSPSVTKTATVKKGEELLFTALVNPTACDQKFTYKCNKTTGCTISEKVLDDGIVFNTSLSAGTPDDPNDPPVTYTALSFVASVAGTYTITLTSSANPAITTTLTITVTN